MIPNLRILLILTFFSVFYGSGQDLGQLGKAKLFSLTGGVAANAVYYEGNSTRDPFTYYLTGNINLNISGVYNIPFSFSYSNQELGYSNPFTFNRLSIHPSYKWITTHIGDVNMTFSPYTLSGHQFTGFGFDLNPEKPFSFSAMYGRLLKATEYNAEEPNAIPAYDRYGFGFKFGYQSDKWNTNLIFFKANDSENSLENPIPPELELAAKDNVVVSFAGGVTVLDRAQLGVEIATSGITEDVTISEERESPGILSILLDENITTKYYNAANLSLTYPAGTGSVGATYERIDPEYRTFGAYFFNNDLENITIDASQSLFQSKVNLTVNAGLQRDNLDKTKSSELQRIVSAFTASVNASEKLTFNGSYSNFQSYTNIRDQFDYINQVGQFDNVDTLNYRQIAQNANLGVNYVISTSEVKNQSSSLNLVYQNSKNLQNEELIEGGANDFYNGSASYTLEYPKNSLNITLSANTSYVLAADSKSLTLGPTLSVGKQLFNKKLRTTISSSYNTNKTDGLTQNSVYNVRLGANYVWLQRHNFNLNLLTLFRETMAENANDFTATLGYSYNFDRLKLKLKRRLIEDEEVKKPKNYVSFRYRNVTYSGSTNQVFQQLTNVFNSSQFENIPKTHKEKLSEQLSLLQQQKNTEFFKESSLNFLKELYAFEDFQELYEQTLFDVVTKLQGDVVAIDEELERIYIAKKTALDEALKQKNNLIEAKNQEKIAEERLKVHRWMQTEIQRLNGIEVIDNPTDLFMDFKDKNKDAAFIRYTTDQTEDGLGTYLENQMIQFYHEYAKQNIVGKDIEFRYILKK